MFNGCTTKVDPDFKPWCSTFVDENGKHVGGYWGYCEEECPLDAHEGIV